MGHRVLPVLLVFAVLPVSAQDGADRIRLNQIGFYPDAPKEAVVVDGEAESFRIIQKGTSETVLEGTLRAAHTWSLSGETVRRADFSELNEPGTYQLVVPELGTSPPFVVEASAHRSVAKAALKAYYFQRASTALSEEYAGPWARAAGHPDTEVRVHASAVTEERPAGTTISAPKGWYDAGDYNKYVVNSGISTYTLLAFLEHYSDFASQLGVNIPEGDNDVPDVLDEAMWNLRWMLDMQDPYDGGVYHKLTSPNFSGAVMPHEDTDARYVVQKSTAATLDFAAVMAQAARIVAQYPDAFPGLADTMRTAAIEAWAWAQRNPGLAYNQGQLNDEYSPNINTGTYGDYDFSDEEAWAAAELFVTTKADRFLTVASPLDQRPSVPSWGSVATLGWFTLLHHRAQAASGVDTTDMKQQFLSFADELVDARGDVPYGTVMGRRQGNFVWGSNSVAGNQAVVLMRAFSLSRDSTYLWSALSNLDYLLGRNATGYSFVTGHGDHTPMDPHHRPSVSDDIEAPVPGLLVGGPNPGQQDGCNYPSDLPAKSYLDDWCSYASNEITINWNAPLFYVAGAIEAALADEGETDTQEPPGLGDASLPRLLPPYPNPTTDQAQVAFELDRPKRVLLSVSDMLGRRLTTLEQQTMSSGVHCLTWDLEGLASGLYVVRLVTERTTRTQTIIKVN